MTGKLYLRRTDTGLNSADFTLVVKDDSDGSLITVNSWSWVEVGPGIYNISCDDVTVAATGSVTLTADPTMLPYGEVEFSFGSSLTPQQIWEYADRTLTEDDNGTGSVLFTWTEYQTGYDGNPNYVVPDVTVIVYSNNLAVGQPIARGVTDETGSVSFYLDTGTYYFFRRKGGRSFTNPATVDVS
jgi:hypothetical protein